MFILVKEGGFSEFHVAFHVVSFSGVGLSSFCIKSWHLRFYFLKTGGYMWSDESLYKKLALEVICHGISRLSTFKACLDWICKKSDTDLGPKNRAGGC